MSKRNEGTIRRGSLTLKIFLITAAMLFAACGLCFLVVALTTPLSYEFIESDSLKDSVDELVNDLETVTVEDSEQYIYAFTIETGAIASLSDESGYTIFSTVSESPDNVISEYDVTHISGEASDYYISSDTLTVSEENWNKPVTFSGSDKVYTLVVVKDVSKVNHTVEALIRVSPYIIAAILLISFIGAFFYSRYITKPIVRLSRLSEKMAALDFSGEYGGGRNDEIGLLGQNLNTLSRRLSDSLESLRRANAELHQDILHEKELERQRSEFFDAASHELKTPITVLKGQLSGMISEIGVYADRNKYLVRSLGVTERMEKLIQEMLTLTRMEREEAEEGGEKIDLSEMLAALCCEAVDFTNIKEQKLCTDLRQGVIVNGNSERLRLAVSNLLTNAITYSPDGEKISVTLTEENGRARLIVENGGTAIPEQSIPHLFEAFYRVEGSRNKATGGSGLGLYLAETIFRKYGAELKIGNADGGVRAEVEFGSAE